MERETVTKLKDIIDNMRQFAEVGKHTNSDSFKRFSNFTHWYYIPREEIFAPSKFIGYKGTTVSKYEGKGDGRKTEEVLKDFFEELPKHRPEFKTRLKELQKFASSIGKSINEKIHNGSGGIHILNAESLKEFLKTETDYSQTLSYIEIEDRDLLEDLSSGAMDGERLKKMGSYFTRNKENREKAIAFHKTTCKVCGFNFLETYGELGKDFIEVHHLKPLHKPEGIKKIDPTKDLTVLCSNCHRMIHRNDKKGKETLTIEELKNLLKRN